MPTLLAAAAAALALVTACGGDGGPDITVEKGLRASGGVAVEGTGGGGVAVEQGLRTSGGVAVEGTDGEGFAFGLAGASGVPGQAGGNAFPLSQQGALTGIVGQGFGRATAPADFATVQFFLERFFVPPPFPEPEPFTGPEPFPEPEPFTEEDLAPIVDALVGQGVSEDDIELIISPFGQPGTAQVRVTVRDPEGRLGPLIEAAREASDAIEGLSFFNVSVLYAVDDCGPLERRALEAAVEDAEERARLLADALGKSLSDLVFATEFVFSPFGPSPCDPQAFAFREFEFFGGMPFDPSQPAEVQLVSNVNLTFAFD